MKILITRTSEWDESVSPCEEAFEDSYIRIDERIVDDPTQLGGYKGDNDRANECWYGNGHNHRVENGHIKRDFNDVAWFINIDTLDELLQLQQKYGELVIREALFNRNMLAIEIYDDYRE